MVLLVSIMAYLRGIEGLCHLQVICLALYLLCYPAKQNKICLQIHTDWLRRSFRFFQLVCSDSMTSTCINSIQLTTQRSIAIKKTENFKFSGLKCWCSCFWSQPFSEAVVLRLHRGKLSTLTCPMPTIGSSNISWPCCLEIIPWNTPTDACHMLLQTNAATPSAGVESYVILTESPVLNLASLSIGLTGQNKT